MTEQAAVWFIFAAAALIGAYAATRWEYTVPSSPYKHEERAHRRNMQVALISALAFLGVTFLLIGAVAL